MGRFHDLLSRKWLTRLGCLFSCSPLSTPSHSTCLDPWHVSHKSRGGAGERRRPKEPCKEEGAGVWRRSHAVGIDANLAVEPLTAVGTSGHDCTPHTVEETHRTVNFDWKHDLGHLHDGHTGANYADPRFPICSSAGMCLPPSFRWGGC